jgi:hypothetical protein
MIAAVALGGCGDNAGKQVVKLVSRGGRSPVMGVRVQVGAQPWTTTDENGEAFFDGGSAPFAVRVHQTTRSFDEGIAEEFDELWELTEQTDNPVVVAVQAVAATRKAAAIAGKVSGRGNASGSRLLVFARTGPSQAVSTLAGPDGSYELPVSWDGESSKMIDLGAIEIDSSSPPRQFYGYGSTALVVTAQADGDPPQGGGNFALGPVTTARVSGKVSLPASLAADVHPHVALEYRDGSSALLHGRSTTGTGTFDYLVPVIDGAAVRVGFTADAINAPIPVGTSYRFRKVTAPAADVDLALPPTARLLEPAAAATFDLTTRFRWEPVSGAGRYALALVCSDIRVASRHEITFHMVETTKTEARIPAIPDLDFGAAQCTWQVGWLDASAQKTFADGLSTDDYQYSFTEVRPIKPAAR